MPGGRRRAMLAGGRKEDAMFGLSEEEIRLERVGVELDGLTPERRPR